MPPGADYYEILEVHHKASPEVIAKAYRTLARRYHPDVYPEDKKKWAEEQMKQLNEAYQVISDPARRSQYDLRRPPRPTQASPPAPSPGSFRAGQREYSAARAVSSSTCYRHPDRPRVGLCQKCGRPICATCMAVRGGTPLCPACTVTPLWERILPKGKRAAGVSSKESWVVVALFAVGLVGTGLGGSALLFPYLLWMWIAHPQAVFVSGCILGMAIWVGVYALLASVWRSFAPGFKIVSAVIAVCVGIGGGWYFQEWLQVDHAALGMAAVHGENWGKALTEVSAGLVLNRGTDETYRQLLHGRVVTLLNLADGYAKARAPRQLRFSRLAIDLAKSAQWKDSSQGTGQVITPDDQLLVEAFSRVSDSLGKWRRGDLWDTARKVLQLPKDPPPHLVGTSGLPGSKYSEFPKLLRTAPGAATAAQVREAYLNAVFWTEWGHGAADSLTYAGGKVAESARAIAEGRFDFLHPGREIRRRLLEQSEDAELYGQDLFYWLCQVPGWLTNKQGGRCSTLVKSIAVRSPICGELVPKEAWAQAQVSVVSPATGETIAASGVDSGDGSFRIFVAPGEYYVVAVTSMSAPQESPQPIAPPQSSLVDVRWDSSQLAPPQSYDVVSGHPTVLQVIRLQSVGQPPLQGPAAPAPTLPQGVASPPAGIPESGNSLAPSAGDVPSGRPRNKPVGPASPNEAPGAGTGEP
jgi:hypothetical protein